MSGVESLTPSERRTAAPAAEGLTNKEIAQALFVTPRTVEMHLTGAFRKPSRRPNRVGGRRLSIYLRREARPTNRRTT
jgi:FixJ family two-component response regulator